MADVEGLSVSFLVDTGAAITLLRTELLEELPKNLVQKVERVNKSLLTATGEVAPLHGCLKARIKLGRKSVNHKVWFADIKNDGILGADFLTSNGCSILLGSRTLEIGGQKVPLHTSLTEEGSSCFRVTIAETVTIPPKSEVLVCGKPIDVYKSGESFVLEPTLRFVERSHVFLAKAVVKPHGSTLPLRVMNVTDRPLTVHKGTIAAFCEPVCSVSKVEDTELDDTVYKNANSVSEHLLDLFVRSTENLTEFQQRQVADLLNKFSDIFSKNQYDIGNTNVVTHEINTGKARPIHQPPRRIPLAKQAEAEKEVKEMLTMGVIEKSSSPWASPIVLVKKKDGSTRFCIDYRKLNEITVKDSHPLPRIDDTLDTLSGATWFSTLDLKSGYWQVDVAEKDRQKTAFVTGYGGFWQFKVMPFGLCNAPATFERLMEQVLTGLTWKLCLVYLDDVIVFASSFEQELEHLTQVLDRVRSAGLKLSPKKCHLFQRQVNFLGHLISGKGIATDPEKVSAVRDWPTPKSLKEVRSFLGMSSYYRRFIKNFSTIARPLHQLMEAGHVFQWTDACESAFLELKDRMLTAPILAYPQRDKTFILDTDASDTGVGAVLSQEQENQERVIAYFSKALSKPERSYCVTRRELLALVKSVKQFHCYLYGRHFKVRTDHGSLCWLKNFKNPEGQLARWLELLSQYDFSIEHRRGKSHMNADGLSRRPCAETSCSYCEKADAKYLVHDDSSIIAAVSPLTPDSRTSQDISDHNESDMLPVDEGISLDRLKDLQSKDKIVSVVVGWKVNGQRPLWEDISNESAGVKHYWSRWDALYLRSGVLYRRFESDDGFSTQWQIVLPESLRRVVLEELHNSETAGHLGIAKTLGKIRDRYYWCGLRKDVEQWCRACDVCARRKRPPNSPKAPLQQYVVGAPLERVAVDVMGPLPETHLGNRYLLVVGDYFTKWCDAYAIPDQEAVTVAEMLVNRFISQFGVPRQLHSDQGRNFESCVFKEMCKILGIDKTRTTPLHPQGDGMVERMNQTLEGMLSIFVDDNQRDWDIHVPLLMMAYRSSIHNSTGVSPCAMMFGREITLPVDLMFGSPESYQPVLQSSYAYDLANKMEVIHDFARGKLTLAHDAMKKNYDHNAKSIKYSEGDAVWLHNLVRRKGYSPKLQLPWTGPFIVINRLTDVTYRIQQSHRSKPRIVHFNRLKPYRGDEKPTWFDDMRDGRCGNSLVTVPSEDSPDQPLLDNAAGQSLDSAEYGVESGGPDDEQTEENVLDTSSSTPSSVSDNHYLVSRRGRRITKPGWHRDYAMDS